MCERVSICESVFKGVSECVNECSWVILCAGGSLDVCECICVNECVWLYLCAGRFLNVCKCVCVNECG